MADMRAAAGKPAGQPGALRRTALLVLLEAVALALLGVGYPVLGLLGEPEDRLGTVLAGALALVAGLALVAVARALGRGRGWALAPTVLVQLFVVAVAVGLLQGGVWAVGVPLVVVAAAVVFGLTRPEVRESLGPDQP